MSESGEEKKTFCVIAHRGEYDKLYETVTLALTYVAMGYETHILFMFDALKKICTGRIDEFDLGAGRESDAAELERNARAANVMPLSQMLDEGRKLGTLRMYGCSAVVRMMGFTEEEVREHLDDVIGLPNFLFMAEKGRLLLI